MLNWSVFLILITTLGIGMFYSGRLYLKNKSDSQSKKSKTRTLITLIVLLIIARYIDINYSFAYALLFIFLSGGILRLIYLKIDAACDTENSEKISNNKLQ